MNWPVQVTSTYAEGAKILPLSAHTEDELCSLVKKYRDQVPQLSLSDVCYTASTCPHQQRRLAVVFHSAEELVERLDDFLAGRDHPNIISASASSASRRIVFVFPGYGSEWLGMGLELMKQEPVFRAAVELCDQAASRYTGKSLIEDLSAPPDCAWLAQADVAGPILLAIQVALATLWRSWGVEPDAVVGQSLGETIAAHVAGALSIEDAARVVCHQGQLLARISGQGVMLLVNLSFQEAEKVIANCIESVAVAISNGPTSTVLSGARAPLQMIARQLDERGIFNAWVKADFAFHSPMMDPLLNDFRQMITGISPHPATIPLYSSITAVRAPGTQYDEAFWVRNLRHTVLFSKVIGQLLAEGYDTFLEISPHPIVSVGIEQAITFSRVPGIVLPSLRRQQPERLTLLRTLGQLYTLGAQVKWSSLCPSGARISSLSENLYQVELSGLSEGRLTNDETCAYMEQGKKPFRPQSFQDVHNPSAMNLAGLTTSSIRKTLSNLPPKEQLLLIEKYLRMQLARILHVASSRIERHTLFATLGFQSIMALELQLCLEAAFEIKFSPTVFWNYLTLEALTEHIAGKLSILAGITMKPESAAFQQESLSRVEVEAIEDDLLQVLSLAEQFSDTDLSQILGNSP